MTTQKQLAQIIYEKLSKSTNQRALAKEIASYLVESRQSLHLPSLMRDVMAIRADAGIIEVDAVSAFDLDAHVKRELSLLIKREHPKVKKVLLDSSLDESVVGGVRLDMPAEQLNLTIHDRMSRFKNAALKGGSV